MVLSKKPKKQTPPKSFSKNYIFHKINKKRVSSSSKNAHEKRGSTIS